MAYSGTENNKAIRKLLHVAVSDVSDDVRRASVIALGFVLFRTPKQLPRVVQLLSESYNPHVRFVSISTLMVEVWRGNGAGNRLCGLWHAGSFLRRSL